MNRRRGITNNSKTMVLVKVNPRTPIFGSAPKGDEYTTIYSSGIMGDANALKHLNLHLNDNGISGR